jgi:hypothetical protein
MSLPMTTEQTDAYISSFTKSLSNVYYLAKGSSIEPLPGYNFIGATMWSYIPLPTSPEIEKRLQTQLKCTPQQYNNEFQTHLKNIGLSIKPNKKNIIVTHHSPLLTVSFKSHDLPRNHLYGTDLSNTCIGLKHHINAWFYGHTHWNFTGVINGTLISSNQYGAKGIEGWAKSSHYWV